MKSSQFRRAALIAAGVALAVSGVAAQSAKRPQKQYTIEQFMNTVVGVGRVVLARRVPHPVLVEQDRHLERLHDPGQRRSEWTPVTDVDDRLDVRGQLLPRLTNASCSRATRVATS